MIPDPFVSLVGIPAPGVRVDPTPGALAALIDAGWTPPVEEETMTSRIKIGYLCSRGHFQMHGDPEGDQCGTKDIAPIYVELADEVDLAYTREITDEALGSYNRKLEEWRRS